MIIVNTHEAKTKLSSLLNLVSEKHEVVRICRNGKVMAELVEPRVRTASKGLPKYPELSGVVFKEDPAAPLSDDFFPDYSSDKDF